MQTHAKKLRKKPRTVTVELIDGLVVLRAPCGRNVLTPQEAAQLLFRLGKACLAAEGRELPAGSVSLWPAAAEY